MQDKQTGYQQLSINEESKTTGAATVAPASEFDDLHQMLINTNQGPQKRGNQSNGSFDTSQNDVAFNDSAYRT